MLSALLHVVSALLEKIVLNRWNKWEDSRITKEQEAHEYEKSVVIAKTVGIAGAVFFTVLLGFGILGLVIWADDRTDWDSFASGILFLLLSLLGVYFILMRRNYRIFYTDSFLEKHSTFGKKRVFAYGQISEKFVKEDKYIRWSSLPETSGFITPKNILVRMASLIFCIRKFFEKRD